MIKKLLYVSDLDRTLIYSGRFLNEHKTDKEISPVEVIGPRVISYMDNDVIKELGYIRKDKRLHFVPVTTRSKSEYERVNLGFTPEYAIVANGGTILYNGEPLEEYEAYIKGRLNLMEAMDIICDIEDELTSVDGSVKIIDGKFLFWKCTNNDLFDEEALFLIGKYPEWEFTRQFSKCYAIPKHFSKQIALRWLWHKLGKPFIVASGDSKLDLPMLTLANRAVIPKHGTLVTDGYVTAGTFVDGGISSPLETFKIIENELKNLY